MQNNNPNLLPPAPVQHLAPHPHYHQPQSTITRHPVQNTQTFHQQHHNVPVHHVHTQHQQHIPNSHYVTSTIQPPQGSFHEKRIVIPQQLHQRQPVNLGPPQYMVSQPVQAPMGDRNISLGTPLLNQKNLRPTSIYSINQDSMIGRPQPVTKTEYIPYESYYIDYEQRQMLTSVKVPVQRKYVDYYTVEHITQYQPRQYEEKYVEMVPEEKITKKRFFIPVQTQIVHFPKDQPKSNIQKQGIVHQVQQQNQQLRHLQPVHQTQHQYHKSQIHQTKHQPVQYQNNIQHQNHNQQYQRYEPNFSNQNEERLDEIRISSGKETNEYVNSPVHDIREKEGRESIDIEEIIRYQDSNHSDSY